MSIFKGVHPTCWIGKNVKIGKGTVVGPYTIIGNNCTIGDNNLIGSFCHIGRKSQAKESGITGITVIGNNNIINDYVSIDCSSGTIPTFIGNGVTIFNYSYIAHDCILNDSIEIGNNVHLAGNVNIGRCTAIKSNSVVNENISIGEYAFIGASSSVTKHILPYMLAAGGYGARPVAYYKHPRIDFKDFKFLRRLFTHVCKFKGSDDEIIEFLTAQRRNHYYNIMLTFIKNNRGFARWRSNNGYRTHYQP